MPEDGQFHHSSGYTHRWRVYADGTLIPETFYHRPWRTSRVDPKAYAKRLPPMPYRSTNLQGQLVDLIAVADAIGLKEAASALHAHIHGFDLLPSRRSFRESPSR